MRPRIGITTSTIDRGPEGPIQISAATHMTYARCIHEAGALPLLLPNVLSGEDAEEMLHSLDGILFSGGGDVDPRYLQEPPHPAITLVDQQRDAFELALLRAAFQRDLPVFGICRGVQMIAVASGGDLWQDIPTQRPDSLVHRQTDVPRNQPSHYVIVVPDSQLARLLWPEGTANHLLPVNSFHHQAPRNCGTLLSVEAASSDGLIEALALPDARFVLGVQWHPEDLVRTDARHGRLFSAFVAAARGT